MTAHDTKGDELRLIDLSLLLTSGMGTFEGTPPVYIAKSHRISEDGFNMSFLAFGNHVGTHLDAPSHFVAGGGGVDTIPLERCIGEAVVCDLSAKHPGESITVDDLAAAAGDLQPGARVLVRTDWDERVGSEEYFTDFPPLAPETAVWLAEREVWLLGVDIPTLHPTEFGPMHETLLAAGVVIVESLANLRQLSKGRVFFSSLPLKIANADGAPVRAVAFDGMPHGFE